MKFYIIYICGQILDYLAVVLDITNKLTENDVLQNIEDPGK